MDCRGNAPPSGGSEWGCLMPPTPVEWARAFAKQARVDFLTCNRLLSKQNEIAPSCQRLNFLQMACEKLCKANLCRTGSDPFDLQSSHAYIAKTLAAVIRDELGLLTRKRNWISAFSRYAKHVAREIELLSPAVDDGGRRPDNCEYPWLDGQLKLFVPMEWTFSVENLLVDANGRLLLKLISAAIDRHAHSL